jgi:hypothetical protein
VVGSAAGRQLAPQQVAAALPQGGEPGAVAAAAQQLAQQLRRCEAGCGAVSALRVLALLLERLGADSQVRVPQGFRDSLSTGRFRKLLLAVLLSL